jgi:hypothetical protein
MVFFVSSTLLTVKVWCNSIMKYKYCWNCTDGNICCQVHNVVIGNSNHILDVLSIRAVDIGTDLFWRWLNFRGVPTQPWQRPATTNVTKTRSRNYSLGAPDDERYHSKHVEQSRNIGIINCPTWLHLVGYFCKICIMMHGSMKVNFRGGFEDGGGEE